MSLELYQETKKKDFCCSTSVKKAQVEYNSREIQFLRGKVA